MKYCHSHGYQDEMLRCQHTIVKLTVHFCTDLIDLPVLCSFSAPHTPFFVLLCDTGLVFHKLFFFFSLPCQHQPMVQGGILWGDCRTEGRKESLSLLLSAWFGVLLLLVVTEGLLWGGRSPTIPTALLTPQQWVACSYSSHSIS